MFLTTLRTLCFIALTSATLLAQPQTTVSIFPSATDTVFSGAQRTIYSNVCAGPNSLGCTPAANYNVSWSTDCAGSLDLSYDTSGTQKYVRFTAPAAPATCHVTAVAADGSGASASASFNVIPDAPTISMVPFNITVYSGQYAILQPQVFGSTNLNVKWQLSGPVTSGVLSPSSQQAVFMSNTPGAYVVTATTQASGTSGPVSAVAYVTVTGNPVPAQAVQSSVTTANGTFHVSTQPVDCSVPADPNWNVYEVYSNADLDAINWLGLGTANKTKPNRGELIRLHYGTYNAQTLLGVSSGNSAKYPIRICGIADPSRGLPVWSGASAHAVKALTGPAGKIAWVGTGSTNNMQQFAVLNINDHPHSWNATADPNGYFMVEGIVFAQAAGPVGLPAGQTSYKYVAYDGSGTYNYVPGTSGLRIGNGHDIVIRGNAFVDNGNGMLTKDNVGRGGRLLSLLVEGNAFEGNGTTLQTQHQAYVEATGVVIQFNRFGHLRSGNTVISNALKTRCLRCYVRFNDLQEGAHLLDAVEPEDLSDKTGTDFLTAMPHLAGYKLPQIAGFEEAFNSSYWFYGNTLKDSLSTSTLLFGGDTIGYCPDAKLYAYNNTLWDAPTRGQYGMSLAFYNFCAPSTTAGWYPSFDLRNNIIYLTQKTGSAPAFAFSFAKSTAERVSLANNYVSYGWCAAESNAKTAPQCGNTVGVLYGAASNQIYKLSQSYQSGDRYLRVSGLPAVGSTSQNRAMPFNASFSPVNNAILSGKNSMPAAIVALPANMAIAPTTGLPVPRQMLYVGAQDQ